MFWIPIPSNNAKFSFSINLDGVVYRFTFTFNTRQLSWDLLLAEQDGTPILSGVKILPGIELLFRHKDSRLPGGLIHIIDPQNLEKGLRPTRNSLSSQAIRLLYMTEAELESMLASDLTNEEFVDAII